MSSGTYRSAPIGAWGIAGTERSVLTGSKRGRGLRGPLVQKHKNRRCEAFCAEPPAFTFIFLLKDQIRSLLIQ